MKFVIPGIPQPLHRHRTCTRNGITFQYDPSKKYKQFVSEHIKKELNRLSKSHSLPPVGYFEVNMVFHFPTNDSDSKAVKNEKLWGVLCPTTVDIDNCYKNYADAANGILYHDDSMIIKGTFEKRFSENPRTEIEIISRKKVMNQNAQEILKLFSPNELKELLQDAKKIALFSEKSMEDVEGLFHGELSTACDGIAAFAIKYADKFKKISNKVNQR